MAEKKQEKTENESTLDGVLEALLSGDVKAAELLELAEEQPELFGIKVKKGTDPKAIAALKQYGQQAQAEEEGCPLPRAKRKRRRKPVTREQAARSDVKAMELNAQSQESKLSFESLVGEALLQPQKENLDEGIHEFAAPERQDVIRWARGDAPQRKRETMPFYFEENSMFSRKKKIAERNLEAKTAKVLSPKVLDAQSGRHAVLAEKGLRYAGITVELVDSLD